MTVIVGEFKNDKYAKVAVALRDVILDYANENHLTLVEAIGILEVVKLELYDEQIAAELDGQ